MFEQRVRQAEYLDYADCDEKLAGDSYKLMEFVNVFGGGTKVVKQFLAREIARENLSRPIRVLDIGSGTCDIPIAITKWAQKNSRKIEYTCIETNRTALQTARLNIARSGCTSITLKNEDFFNFVPQMYYDYATASSFFHHLDDEQIVDSIKKLRSYVRSGILLNDLRRNTASYICGFVLSLPLVSGARHDALLSIRKGFKDAELHQLLTKIDCTRISMQTANFSRLAAIIRFEQRGT